MPVYFLETISTDEKIYEFKVESDKKKLDPDPIAKSFCIRSLGFDKKKSKETIHRPYTLIKYFTLCCMS